MKLNELSPAEGSIKNRTRVGRGIASGKGKTAGKGHKGQKARKGVAINGYEGGQMPIYMRLPKRGFNAWRPTKLNQVTLARLQEAVDSKKLDAKTQVTAESLKEAGVINRLKDGVKIIGNEGLKTKLTFKVNGATKGATAAIEKAGGSVELIAKTELLTSEDGRKLLKNKDKKPRAPKTNAAKAAAKAPKAKK
ncbi:MAG: 50S ribosomal protein L15 [Micavibrio sp.]|nr:50S ribosomal protein L15 [Micavibrio sp.]|tara:strand:- start:51 stop:629 length:579 start_codon:yes stop_codon:yes gene_type:complete